MFHHNKSPATDLDISVNQATNDHNFFLNLFSGSGHKETTHFICSHVLWTLVDWSGQHLPHWRSVDGWQLSHCAAAAVTCRPQPTGQSLRPDLTVMDGSVSLSWPPPNSWTHAEAQHVYAPVMTCDRWEDSMSTANSTTCYGNTTRKIRLKKKEKKVW